MFDYSSRYYNLPNATYVDSNGNTIVYKQRRFLPQVSDQTLIAQVTVTAGDRLDLIANRTLNNSLLFWQVADSNNAMNPFDLVQPGNVLQVLSIS
jgi:nucleoid-associated protein YgaU